MTSGNVLFPCTDVAVKDGHEPLPVLRGQEIGSDGQTEQPFFQAGWNIRTVKYPLAVLFCRDDDGGRIFLRGPDYLPDVGCGESVVVRELQMSHNPVGVAQIFHHLAVIRNPAEKDEPLGMDISLVPIREYGNHRVIACPGEEYVSFESEVLRYVPLSPFIQICRARKKPVIIATQMLHSMIENPRPTRAEVTDVANAIFQSTDAIMLSGETASGKYPVEAVKTMSRIAKEIEKSIDISLDLHLEKVHKPIAAVLARSLVASTKELPVKAIIFDTWTGRTGRYLAESRPKVPIYAMCYNASTMRELNLTYDIYAYKFDIQKSKEDMVRNSIRILEEDGRLQAGDLVGFIGGSFNDELGATYMEFKYV